jgi:uncharacterized protein involved in exopolysaccharide biosynthesis
MNGTLSLPPSVMVRDLLVSGFHSRRLIFIVGASVMFIALCAAVKIVPKYEAKSSLLVLLGTEHAYRPVAGQPFSTAGAPEYDQVLRTESDILGSDELHRQVIEEIGVQKLYPKLFEPKSLWRQWVDDAKTAVESWLGASSEGAGNKKVAPINLAITEFDDNLSVTVDRKSSIIKLAFRHRDPALAADVLRTLEADYFTLRQKLYSDKQVPIIQVQQEAMGKQLADADNALASFKHEHDIGSFDERRKILLEQQGRLEATLAGTESRIAELGARVGELDKQLHTVSGGKSPASALQGMVEAYRQRQREAGNTYRGSASVDEARQQALARETEVARMQSTQAFAVQSERLKADADLRANTAARDSLRTQLASVKAQVDSINADEAELHRLERNRSILEDNYRAITKTLDERRVVENVDANGQSSVRVVQPPRIPALPLPIRKLILLAGVAISVVLAAMITLMSHFFRTIYLRPEALEMDTGLTVLASVPETKQLARSSLVVSPG